MKKWLFYQPETDIKAKVMLIYHRQPTQEEIQEVGLPYIETENYHEPEQRFGKTGLPYVNPQTGEYFVEYVDRPLSTEEEREKRISDLENLVMELSLEG